MNTTLELTKLNLHSWSTESKNGLFLVPTKYLHSISNPDATETSDMGDGTGRQFSKEDIFKRILEQGMRDPLYVSVYLPNHNEHPGLAQIRLEAGNHRVRAALEMGVTHLPVAAFVSSNPYFHAGNGTHLYDINRKDVEKTLNRGPEDFEPYPHPIDLKVLLKDLDVYYSKEIITVKNENGLITFY
jgi:hypothetical protein